MKYPQQHVLIIAEAGVNHNGDLDIAKRLIDMAADAGADLVKFQTFRSELNISGNAPKAAYQQRNTAMGESQLDMVRKLELSVNDHELLHKYSGERGIGFLSTPFDAVSVDLLCTMGIGVGKVPSGELTNKPHLQLMARSFPELLVSTGMCDLNEVAAAIKVLEEAGAKRDRIILLHCNTEYPTPMTDVNLRAMRTLAESFGTRVGYSDHTLGIEVPIAAVALGAMVIEKHITLDRGMPGPDHRASLEPDELKAMVGAIRNISMALGTPEKTASPSERANIPIARKSIHLYHDLKAGSLVTAGDLVMLRPGDGISPMRIDEVIGRRTLVDLARGRKLVWTDLT